jgi:hypothetical protein
MYASPCATAQGVLRDELAPALSGSGRDVIDYDVDESVVTDPVGDFAERIAAAGHWIA